MLEDERCRSAGAIAEAEGITRSFVNRLLRLTLLAPDIQEEILDGRQAKGMQLEELTRAIPAAWEGQRQRGRGDSRQPQRATCQVYPPSGSPPAQQGAGTAAS
jgi:hypothetical protein